MGDFARHALSVAHYNFAQLMNNRPYFEAITKNYIKKENKNYGRSKNWQSLPSF